MKRCTVTGIEPIRLLIPLSIFSFLVGTLPLIGTSTNLIVDVIVRDAGMPRFGIFEITPIGLVTAASGIISLAAMWWLLPSDKPVNGTGGAADAHQYLTELILQDGDELIGQRVGAFKGLPWSGRSVVEIGRAHA